LTLWTSTYTLSFKGKASPFCLLALTGRTLTLDVGGMISGGTIDSTAGTLNLDGGTLSDVTFDGPLKTKT
jgi:hypothetical protein